LIAACSASIGDAQHVIRFVIRQMDLQHLDLPINRVDQAGVLRQAMHRADASARQPAHPIAVLILNIARLVHRSRLRLPHARSQPPLDPSFALRHLLMSTRLHSKCPPRLRACGLPTNELCYGVRTFRVFRLHAEPQTRL
jgi:hypothetical protein